jgi:protein-disulfide isomerase
MQGQRPRYARWLFCTAALRALPGAQALFDAGLGKTAPMLAKNQALADQLRIQGTPALIVGDFIFRGAVDPSRLAAAIEATRASQIKAASAKS